MDAVAQDGEIIAYAISEHIELSLIHILIGAYAIAVLDKDNPDGIIAARKSSPLVVGIGEGEFFLASDATPIVEYTDKVVYLEDEEIALIRRGEKPVSYTHLDVYKRQPHTLPFFPMNRVEARDHRRVQPSS